MQLFYALNRDEKLEFKDISKLYSEWIDKTFELFLFNIYCNTEICKLSVDDGKKRKSKHLPKDIDKVFTAKLFENELIQSVANNATLNRKFKKLDFDNKVNRDYLSKIYDEYAKSEAYQKYILEGDSKEAHLETILDLYRSCRSSELYNEMMDDNYYNWSDDKSLVVGTFKKFIKAQPEEEKYFESLYPDAETVDEFGRNLLESTHKDFEKLGEIINPVIENWDHERVAILDALMLKMAVSEMLNCSSIPGKVTLNEYVEVSKKYSTPKSKEFINGVLDKILKTLTEKGEIKKEGRGLVD